MVRQTIGNYIRLRIIGKKNCSTRGGEVMHRICYCLFVTIYVDNSARNLYLMNPNGTGIVQLTASGDIADGGCDLR
jgi:hypothetical protein